jgi:hypothetical protein
MDSFCTGMASLSGRAVVTGERVVVRNDAAPAIPAGSVMAAAKHNQPQRLVVFFTVLFLPWREIAQKTIFGAAPAHTGRKHS